MMKNLLGISFAALTVLQSAHADENTAKEQAFNQAYAALKTALSNNDAEQTKLSAKKSYELGCDFYGRTSERCFELTDNYAEIMDELADFDEAEIVYRDALAKMAIEYGDNSIEVGELALNILQSLSVGTNHDVNDFIVRFLSYRIDDAADELERQDPLAAGEFWFKAIQAYNRHGYRNKKEILKAYQLMDEHSKTENQALVVCRFMAAKYYFHKRDIDDGIELHEKNIQAMEQLNDPQLKRLEIQTRGLLITSYQREGNRKKEQQHLVGLAKITPWSKNAEPIYRTGAEYPEYAWHNNMEGTVILRFDLDKSGRPKNIKVVSADHGNTFKRSAIKSLRKWRFLPKLENGKPVKAKGLETSVSFALAK